MTFEKCKELKDAGFPQWNIENDGRFDDTTGKTWHGAYMVAYSQGELKDTCIVPTLKVLIDACGNDFLALDRLRRRGPEDEEGFWWASYKTRTNQTQMPDIGMGGETPEEAVANLWIAINKK